MRKSFSTNNNGTTNIRPSPSLSLALVNIFQSVQSLLSPRPCDVAVTGPIIGPIMGGLSFLWIIREIPRQKLKTKWTRLVQQIVGVGPPGSPCLEIKQTGTRGGNYQNIHHFVPSHGGSRLGSCLVHNRAGKIQIKSSAHISRIQLGESLY